MPCVNNNTHCYCTLEKGNPYPSCKCGFTPDPYQKQPPHYICCKCGDRFAVTGSNEPMVTSAAS